MKNYQIDFELNSTDSEVVHIEAYSKLEAINELLKYYRNTPNYKITEIYSVRKFEKHVVI